MVTALIAQLHHRNQRSPGATCGADPDLAIACHRIAADAGGVVACRIGGAALVRSPDRSELSSLPCRRAVSGTDPIRSPVQADRLYPRSAHAAIVRHGCRERCRIFSNDIKKQCRSGSTDFQKNGSLVAATSQRVHRRQDHRQHRRLHHRSPTTTTPTSRVPMGSPEDSRATARRRQHGHPLRRSPDQRQRNDLISGHLRQQRSLGVGSLEYRRSVDAVRAGAQPHQQPVHRWQRALPRPGCGQQRFRPDRCAFWKQTLYVEAGGYRAEKVLTSFMSAGVPDDLKTKLEGTKHYWRAALTHARGRQHHGRYHRHDQSHL